MARAIVTPLPDPWTADPFIDPPTTHQWIEIVAAFRRGNGLCGICHQPVDLTIEKGPQMPSIDHIVPQSKGGGDERANLQLAHRGCNSRKGAR